MTNNNLTDEQLSDMLCDLTDLLGDINQIDDKDTYGMFDGMRSAVRELQQYRKAVTPELKLAHLANKFYERYPLESFGADGERAEALGYFMAGAELQCFGEFVKYEDLCGDE